MQPYNPNLLATVHALQFKSLLSSHLMFQPIGNNPGKPVTTCCKLGTHSSELIVRCTDNKPELLILPIIPSRIFHNFTHYSYFIPMPSPITIIMAQKFYMEFNFTVSGRIVKL